MALLRALPDRPPAAKFRWLSVAPLLLAACVEPFGGSNIQVSLAGGVHIPGLPADGGRPPPATHYSFYAFKFDFLTEPSGAVVIGEDGEPVVTASFAFRVTDFEVLPVIDQSSPCFIEDDESRFPGLHVTQYANKLREQTGISDPLAAPAGTPEGDIIDVLTADVRIQNLGRLQNRVKVVTDASPVPMPEADEDCAEEGGAGIPPARCIEAGSNAQRRELCREFWAANPTFYEGSDKVFALPLNGKYHGLVVGTDPRNDAPLGGAGFFVDTVFDDIDGLAITWQYDDVDGDGDPDYPAEIDDNAKSLIGTPYMDGRAVRKTRGVINFPMASRSFTNISGEAAVWSNLDEDSVHF